MLGTHYARNRTPKAPKPSRVHRSPSANFATPPPPPPPSSPPGPDDNPRNLGSYPPRWQEVICYAKRTFRAYVAGKNGFPDAVTGVKEAREYLEEALAVHLESGATVEPGKLGRHAYTHSNNLFRSSNRARHDHARK